MQDLVQREFKNWIPHFDYATKISTTKTIFFAETWIFIESKIKTDQYSHMFTLKAFCSSYGEPYQVALEQGGRIKYPNNSLETLFFFVVVIKLKIGQNSLARRDHRINKFCSWKTFFLFKKRLQTYKKIWGRNQNKTSFWPSSSETKSSLSWFILFVCCNGGRHGKHTKHFLSRAGLWKTEVYRRHVR